jgi:hypothetical protein
MHIKTTHFIFTVLFANTSTSHCPKYLQQLIISAAYRLVDRIIKEPSRAILAELLVQSPQPIFNPNRTLNQKQFILQRLLEVEVAGLCFLLLLI